MALFVGRLPTYDFDDRDLEDIFYKYGRILNCQLKRGTRFGKLLNVDDYICFANLWT